VRELDGSLLRVARTFVGSQSVAEEVVQETWLAVVRGLPRFEGRSSFKTWIFRILTNRAKSRGVREKRSVPASSLAEDADLEAKLFDAQGGWQTVPKPMALPEQALLRGELGVHLKKALEELPEMQRAVVSLRDVEGLESSEVCELLDLSEANQRVLLHRGRMRLREILRKDVSA
jgi:RNA polymerase sigma-70 factor (ECF subfamily)